jgi:MFS family permease
MTFGGLQSASGKFLKFFPLKQAFLSAIIVFGVGSLLCATAKGSAGFIVGRSIAGVGAAGIVTGAFTIIALVARPHIRPQLMGLLGAVYGFSSVLGPILGGLFCDQLSWRWW